MLIVGDAPPAHTAWLPDITEVGRGLTVTVAVMFVPLQPPAVGVTVNVTITGDVVVFVNAPVILPDPLDAIPVTEPVLFLVQVYEAAPLKTTGVIVAPEQIVCDDGAATATLAAAFTSTVDVTGVPAQPFLVGVMVNVTVSCEAVVFVKAPVILPDPLDAIPVIEAVLSLVQL